MKGFNTLKQGDKDQWEAGSQKEMSNF